MLQRLLLRSAADQHAAEHSEHEQAAPQQHVRRVAGGRRVGRLVTGRGGVGDSVEDSSPETVLTGLRAAMASSMALAIASTAACSEASLPRTTALIAAVTAEKSS